MSRSGPATDGRHAVELARQDPPDLYLFDVDMPRLDGLSAARELTEQGLRRPIVVITGVDDPDLIDRSVATGVSAYLTKPIDDRALDAAIRLASSRHEEFRALEAEVTKAQQALEDRKLIEQAKGILHLGDRHSRAGGVPPHPARRPRSQPPAGRGRAPDRRAAIPARRLVLIAQMSRGVTSAR